MHAKHLPGRTEFCPLAPNQHHCLVHWLKAQQAQRSGQAPQQLVLALAGSMAPDHHDEKWEHMKMMLQSNPIQSQLWLVSERGAKIIAQVGRRPKP